MPSNEAGYRGDDVYCLECTGDAVRGDEVRFDRATFAGSWRNATFAGYERVTGKIVKDSYGGAKQQHTFTILREDGTTLLIKGRNLYKNRVWRKRWDDERERGRATDEKHARGECARAARDERKAEFPPHWEH